MSDAQNESRQPLRSTASFKSGEDRIRTCGPHYRVTDLANPRFRPLSHLSKVLSCNDLRLLWNSGFASRTTVSYYSQAGRIWLLPRGMGSEGSCAICTLSQSEKAHVRFYSKAPSPKSDYRPTELQFAFCLRFPGSQDVDIRSAGLPAGGSPQGHDPLERGVATCYTTEHRMIHSTQPGPTARGVRLSIPFDTFAFSGTEGRAGGFSGMRVRESLR